MLWPDVMLTLSGDIVVHSNGATLRKATAQAFKGSYDPRYLGFSYSSKRIYVTRRDGPMEAYDAEFNLLGRCFADGMDNTHGCVFHHGDLHAVNSSRDEIITFKGGGAEYAYHPLDNRTVEQRSGNNRSIHPNMISVDPDGGFWVTQTPVGRWDGNVVLEAWPYCPIIGVSAIRRLDADFNTIAVVEFGVSPHGVHREGNVAFIPSSREQNLYKVNLEDWSVLASYQTRGHWLRGIAATSEFIIVGETGWNSIRKERDGVASCLTMLDRDLNIIDQQMLTESGNIGDIHIINQPDLAHNEYVLNIS